MLFRNQYNKELNSLNFEDNDFVVTLLFIKAQVFYTSHNIYIFPLYEWVTKTAHSSAAIHKHIYVCI